MGAGRLIKIDGNAAQMAPTKRPMRKRKPKNKIARLTRDVSRIKRELELAEVKNFDGNLLTSTLIAWDYSNVYNLFAPPQGDGINNRDGDEVFLKSIDLKFRLQNSSSTNLNNCRVIVWIDEDNSLAGTNVYATTSFINTINAPYAHYNRAYRRQFVVLFDQVYDLDVTDTAQKSVRVNLPVNRKVTFSTGSTAILQNAPKIMFVSNQAAAAPSTTSATYYARCWFTDK